MLGLIQLSFRTFLLAVGEQQRTHHPILCLTFWSVYKSPESDFAFGIVLLMSLYHPDQGRYTIIELCYQI